MPINQGDFFDVLSLFFYWRASAKSVHANQDVYLLYILERSRDRERRGMVLRQSGCKR